MWMLFCTIHIYILNKFNCHVNVEACRSNMAVKYVFKGYNFAKMELKENDEIYAYLNARYVSGIEAANRIFGYPLVRLSHSIEKLYFHLPSESNKYGEKSMLLGYFNLVCTDEFAESLVFFELPQYYRLENNTWIRKSYKKNVLARMNSCSLKNVEKYCLRLLLFHIKGAKSFECLRTIDGIVHG